MTALTTSVELATAIEAAHAAGALLLQALGGRREVRHKGEIDIVTDADEAAEAAIVTLLSGRFPTDGVLAEEGTATGLDRNRLWIIDPLDGTTNFAHGYPIFAVSIALEVAGVVELGVVYQPAMDELFVATRGGGAFLNERPIRVSETEALRSGLLCTGFSYDQTQLDREMEIFGRFARSAQAIRRDGSAALNLSYLAAGRFDGFWERTLRPWDVAAGGLIVAEAGGTLSSFAGEQWDIRAADFVASNGHLHDRMLQAIAGPARESA
ncbi:MAG: inositol monophosphatase [Chloroflexi bacterium]|nr:inositol monophosphatase [Chloroflexota bacterium]